MADLTITAANVIRGANAVITRGTAGAAITAGQIIYADASDAFQLADADAFTAGVTEVFMALNGAATGQPVTALKSGDVALGAILTAGSAYYLSGTAGGIMPAADLTVGDEVVQLGLASSTTTLKFRPTIPGVEL
ncbi:MAG: hypothetical protein Tp176DCM1853251_59 [Prokaryotic dsDNA virus sp.]|nr:MAG: hypothetical protein Tp176DCM1853251_59 [Prokaryotic dsDNA virus sp.]|tara:strand:- start:7295 stop:7699 length:405 start_codon:yes stop_codon:yes gene_type:complete